MSKFVLVHGSWHGAWCWYKIVPRLRSRGHEVIAVDLPGHGRDRTSPELVTMDAYVECILEAVDAAEGPVILVAHSRGGIAVTQAAEERPGRIQTLVYLAAYLLADGERVLDVAPTDTESLALPNLEFDPSGHWDMLKEEAFVPALYADCPEEDVELARVLLVPEPIQPSMTPMRTTPERFGAIPRVYIELLEDRAVGLKLQRRMQAATPCDHVVSINASHSAYFSRPDELTEALHAAAAEQSARQR